MAGFSINNDLFVLGIFLSIFLLDFLLQAEYYRASGVDDFNIIAAGDFIGLGRFPVGTQQNFGIVQMIKVEIDEGSGFCFGVVTAINKAEEELANGGTLYCLGDIVHNSREVERLKEMGLITINHDDFNHLHNAKVPPLASSSSALFIAVTTPKQKPEPSSISTFIII